VAAPLFKGRLAGNEVEYTGLLILAAILLLPALFPEKIGWLATLIPLPVFFYYTRLGGKRGSALIRNAIVLAAGGSLLFGALPNLVFSLTMVPLGIVLSHGVFKRKSLIVTGFTGFLILAITWLLYWAGLAVLFQSNPYGTLLTEIDRGLSNGLMVYEKSAGLKPDTMDALRQAVNLLRDYFPKILPALLVSALLSITWLNLALGDGLLKKKTKEQTPWPEYIEWKLPDSLVWLVILSGVFCLLLPKPLSIIGLNGLIICSTLYFFQGLAIAASFLKRWSVPGLVRVLIYALIFIQTYGIIILSFLGLADVWADFRKLDQAGDASNSSL
jgi:uncharacterized protein YybS (DUF2232 family)